MVKCKSLNNFTFYLENMGALEDVCVREEQQMHDKYCDIANIHIISSS